MSENREPGRTGDRNVSRMPRLDPRVCYRALADPRRALRRSPLRRRDLDRDLLPSGLPGAHGELRELPLLRLRGGGAGGGVPPLPALPARDGARPWHLARHREHGHARAGADRGRRARRRRGGRRRAGRAAGRGGAPAAPAVPAAPRRLAPGRRADPARAVRQAADPRHAPADGARSRSRRASAACAASTRPFSSCSAARRARCAGAAVVALPEGSVAGSRRDRAPALPRRPTTGRRCWRTCARARSTASSASTASLRAHGVRGRRDRHASAVAHVPERQSLAVTIRFPNVRALPAIVARVRHVFDLGADVAAIGAHLARDPVLAPLVALRPGLRVPGGWDGFELAVRAILGQQVTVEAGRQLAGALARACGRPVRGGAGRRPRASIAAFPTAAEVAGTDPAALQRLMRMPAARRRALQDVARAAVADPLLFQPLGTIDETAARLQALPRRRRMDRALHRAARRARAGRVSRERHRSRPRVGQARQRARRRGAARAGPRDLFPTGIETAGRQGRRRQGRGGQGPRRPPPTELHERAAHWRPWRGYAAQHLWTADAARSSQGGSP